MFKYFLDNQNVIREQSNDTFSHNYDVIVCGLGTAGSVALITAARLGLNTYGVEPLHCMGGIGTAGGIHSYYFGSDGGIQTEIDQRCDTWTKQYNAHGACDFHPDVKKLVLEEMANEAGAKFAFESIVSACYVEEQRLIGVEVYTPTGIQRIRSQFIIDASGDAHIAAMIGCAYRFGRDVDHYPQPYSFIRGQLLKNNGIHGLNFDCAYVDPRNPQDMSNACIVANAMHCLGHFNAENKIVTLYPQMGLREGRFIIGEESILFDDIINERQRDNLVMQSYSHYDNHATDYAFESTLSQELATVCGLLRRKQIADIPPGIFIPKGWDGLLIAGRSVSLDHDSHQGIRMQKDMQKFGEICASMAHLSLQHQCLAKDIPIQALQAMLLESGCLTPESERFEHLTWIEDLSEIKAALEKEQPGDALWSCRRKGPVIAEELLSWTRSENTYLRQHAILGLGLVRDRRAIPMLHNLIQAHEHETSLQSYGKRLERRFAPFVLLGIFADSSSASILLDLLHTIKNEAVLVSYICVALCQIAEQNKDQREHIAQSIIDYLVTQRSHLLAMARNPEHPLEMNGFLRSYMQKWISRWQLDISVSIDEDFRCQAIIQ